MRNILIALMIFVSIAPGLTWADLNNRELRITLQSSLISLNPGGIQDSQSLLVSRQVNCQLVRSQGSIYVLDAAESIKYITPLKIILKISNKAKFHDGTLVQAEDVLASFNYIKESRNILRNLFVWLDKIEAIDNSTIVFSLKNQAPQFLKVLSSTSFSIFKKDFLEQARKDKSLWKRPLGCGGYKVAEFTNKHINLIPVSQGLPITFYLIKTNQIDASELGKYDIITLNVIGQTKDWTDFNHIDMFDPLQFYIGLNTKSGIWKNKNDRCKFLSGIDIQGLLASYGKPAVEANDLLPRGTLGYNAIAKFNDKPIISRKSTDIKLNLKLKPFCLAYLTVSVQEKYKAEYLNMIRSIYPNVFMKPIVNTKKFGKDFVKESCDGLIFAWKSYYLDGYEYLTFFEDNDANFSGTYNKALSNQILNSQNIPSAKNRAIEYQKIIKEINALCIVRPLFTVPTRRVYIRKNLKTPGIGLVTIHQYYLGNISR